jgi:CDP-diacylglycerol---serine O-phosphatidyltransferase
MKLKKHLPNAVTCMNLLCGCIAILCSFPGILQVIFGNHDNFFFHRPLVMSGFAIFAAAIFDFADGFVARALHVKSEIGKQLDSLADVVSFGVAPGIIMFHLVLMGEELWKYGIPNYVALIALILPVFSALRLAKFNIDTRQEESFIGLPTPAMGLLIASLPLLASRQFESPLFPFNSYILHFVLNPWLLIASTLLFSYLMVSKLPMFAMKFRNWKWNENKVRYLFIIVSVLLILLFFFTSIPIVILLYIVISFIRFLTNKAY